MADIYDDILEEAVAFKAKKDAAGGDMAADRQRRLAQAQQTLTQTVTAAISIITSKDNRFTWTTGLLGANSLKFKNQVIAQNFRVELTTASYLGWNPGYTEEEPEDKYLLKFQFKLPGWLVMQEASSPTVGAFRRHMIKVLGVWIGNDM